MTSVHVFENDGADPAKRLRVRWGQNLADAMEGNGKMTRKQLQRALEAEGLEVSLQAIGYWLKGDTAPRAHHQAVIAKVLKTRAHLLFPAEAA